MTADVGPPVGVDDVRITWATHAAARYACERWHYSGSLPSGKLVKVGLWEDGRFAGVVIFSRGAAPALGRPYGLDATEVAELTRVALADDHMTPTTRVVAKAIGMLRTLCPGLRLIVSFADAAEGHTGVIYQAGNWTYTGASEQSWFRVHGRLIHPKTLHSRYGEGGQSVPWLRANVDPRARRVRRPPKYRYLYPLDRRMRRQVARLAQPYPRGRGVEGDAPGDQPGDAGSTPAARST